MNKKHRIGIILTLIVLLAAILLGSLLVTAQTACDALVIDEANVFGDKIARVEATAKDLVSAGADIRVRTIQSFGTAGNLDRFEQQLEKQCASWAAPDGTRKNNLIVLMISLQERKTGLYYGSHWESALGAHWTRIQTEIMNPRFRENDFAGGFVNGLKEVQRLVGQQVSGRGAPQPSGGLSAWWIVLIGIVILSGAIAGLLQFRSYRKNRERRLAVRQKARLSKQGAASRVNELVEAIQMLEIKVNATAAKVSEDDGKPLLDGLNKAKKLVDNGARDYSDLNNSAGDPDSLKRSEAQYVAIEGVYQKLLAALHEADAIVSDLETQIDSLQQAMVQFPGKVAEVNAAVDEALKKQEAAQKAGFKTTYPAEILARAGQSLGQAMALSQKKQFVQAVKCAGEAKELASQAALAAEELPQNKQEAEAALPALASRIEQVKQAIINGRHIFEKISSTYAESSWEPIRGNGTEAENRVNWTVDALDILPDAQEQQEWHKSLELVKKGNSWLDEAGSFMRSISALEVSLAAAQRDASREITDAKADITKAWEYIHKYDEDIRESLEDDLREAEKKVKMSDNELSNEKADYLRVCKLAREANGSADKILAQARGEHDAAERLRAQAASAVRDSQASVSKAKEYLEDHEREVSHTAKAHLREAQAALKEAETASDINARISFAGKAEAAAETAYSAARNDVNRAEAERTSGPVVITGGRRWGSRWGGGWSTGGGGWSSGSRHSGGGGSTGWGFGGGGGGGGGGGSTGW